MFRQEQKNGDVTSSASSGAYSQQSPATPPTIKPISSGILSEIMSQSPTILASVVEEDDLAATTEVDSDSSDSDMSLDAGTESPISAHSPVNKLKASSFSLDDQSSTAMSKDSAPVSQVNSRIIALDHEQKSSDESREFELLINQFTKALAGKIERKPGVAADELELRVKRSISHVIREAAEVVSWIPKVKSSPITIIHYINPLFDTMYSAAQLAGDYGYCVKRTFHRRDAEPIKKNNKLPRALDKDKTRAEDLTWSKGADVIIPICIGYKGALSEKALEDVVESYKNAGVNSLTVYFGEYNNLNNPVNQLETIGKEMRQIWIQNNQATLDKYQVRVLCREELIQQQRYKDALLFVYTKLKNGELKSEKVELDAVTYLEGRLKNNVQRVNGSSSSSSSFSNVPAEHVEAALRVLTSGVNQCEKIDVVVGFFERMYGPGPWSKANSNTKPSNFTNSSVLFGKTAQKQSQSALQSSPAAVATSSTAASNQVDTPPPSPTSLTKF